MEHWRRVLLVAFCLAALAPAATACINDGSLINSESEFRSRYPDQAPVKKTGPERSPYTLPLTGAVLLLGAFVVTWRGRRRPGEAAAPAAGPSRHVTWRPRRLPPGRE
jgi:LPXTG-motif cell wall-anchored protein